MTETPIVSIVVPTWNRAEMLAECLTRVSRLEYPRDRFDVVVVDDGSTDGTADVVRRFQAASPPPVTYVRLQHRGLNVARNAGVAAARADLVCFVDDDVEAPPGWLRAMVNAMLRHPAAGCLGGPIRLSFDVAPPRICEKESWALESEFDRGPTELGVPNVTGANMAIRRWAIERVGGFDESLSGPGDETEWQRRLAQAGIPIVYVPAAGLYHRRTAAQLRPMTLLKRRFRQGRATVRFARCVGDPLSVWAHLVDIPVYLAHSMRRRCFGALMSVTWKIGFVWGVIETGCRARGATRRGR